MKHSIIFPNAGHNPLPHHKVIRETLAFFDRYLGPVGEPSAARSAATAPEAGEARQADP